MRKTMVGGLLVVAVVRDFPEVLTGAILALFLERLFDFSKDFVGQVRKTHPLKRILDTIATEDTYIYIEPFYRDQSRPDEFRLHRYELDRPKPLFITGTPYVYGHGDALALSLVQKTIERASTDQIQVFVETAALTLNQWGQSSFCIGAHNSRTREILNKFDEVEFQFSANYSAITRAKPSNIIENEDGITFAPAVSRQQMGDSSWNDYGMIVKLQDQFHPSRKTIIIIAGIGDQGTAGAAYYLFRHYALLPYEKGTFSVLIEVPSGYQSARQVSFDDVKNNHVIVRGSPS